MAYHGIGALRPAERWLSRLRRREGADNKRLPGLNQPSISEKELVFIVCNAYCIEGVNRVPKSGLSSADNGGGEHFSAAACRPCHRAKCRSLECDG